MLSGIQYCKSLEMEAISNGGFSYAEIPYEIIEREELPIYKKEQEDSHTLRVSGFSYPLSKLTPDKLYEMLTTCTQYGGNYIVLETMNCHAGILESVVEECAMMITDFAIPIFVENGCQGDDESGYTQNGYSDVSQLIKIADYCNRLCERAMVGICYSVGNGNLLARNIRKQLYQCRSYLCMLHANDNGGIKNEKQMPYTFTKGRGTLSTDWYRIIGELIRMDFAGWMIFDAKGLFQRCPRSLQVGFVRLLYEITKEWENQCTFAERILNQPEKKLIIFGAGQMLADYMRLFGDKYPPYFAVDNSQSRWNTELMGVPIKQPEEILKIPSDERNVVICCTHYDAIGVQLRQMRVSYNEFQDRYFL